MKKRFKAFNMETNNVDFECNHEWEMMGFLSDLKAELLPHLMILDTQGVQSFSVSEFRKLQQPS